MNEFERIERYFAPLAANRPEALGLKDDAALYQPPEGCELILTMDAIIEGVHFLKDAPPAEIAARLIAVNLSDIAAKGAKPYGYLLTIALPKSHDDTWLAAFVSGLKIAQDTYDVGLLGGDSVHLPEGSAAMFSLTAIGVVPKGEAVLRSTAQIGDDIYVSGFIGDAYIGLSMAQNKIEMPSSSAEKLYFEKRIWQPVPRLPLISFLRQNASAAADVSDGLLADLGHICRASKLSAEIHLAKIPISEQAQNILNKEQADIMALITGGDDYEIVFTAPPKNAGILQKTALKTGIPLTKIGVMQAQADMPLMLIGQNGPLESIDKLGYRHS